jgi:hypothetical protein
MGRDGQPLLLVPTSGSLPVIVSGYLSKHAATLGTPMIFGGTTL